MKVAFAEDNVKGAAGLQETAGFKIAANAHAFKMLSSGLYSDKVRAVLREIGCNAQDAHIAVGTPKRPIVVKLPNELDTQFYIQDWGPGLSHDDVMNLYSTYFASTKQQSNDFTGAFGLGSKSPFSYTDSFSVVSVHSGRKRTYAIYLDNKGAPTTSLMSEEDPDKGWDRGVRVGFPVKPQHFAEFQQKAQLVFQWFDTPPEIRGAQPITPISYRSQCEDYRVLQSADENPVLLMGSVAYPLDYHQLGVTEALEQDGSRKLVDYIKVIKGLVVPVPIGTVQVAASREHIQYDKDSVAALRERFGLIVKRVGREVTRVMEEAERGGWKELCAARDKVQELLRGEMSWDFARFATRLGLDKEVAKRYAKFIQQREVEVPKTFGTKAAFRYVHRDISSRKGIETAPVKRILHDGLDVEGRRIKLEIHPDTAVAYGAPTNVRGRARRACLERRYMQLVVVTGDKTVAPTYDEMKGEAERIAKEMGGIPLVDLSTLPEPTGSTSASRKRRPKDWVPTLDRKASVKAVTTKGEESMTLGELAGEALYMCLVTKSSWSSSRTYYRLYDQTEDADGVIAEGVWNKAWEHYKVLSKAVGVPGPKAYAQVSATDIRRLYLKQLGWRWASTALAEYVQRKDVRDALRARCTKFKPALPQYTYNNGFVSRIAEILMKEKHGTPLWASVDRLDLRQTVEDIIEETRRQGNQRGMKPIPPELDAYRQINSALKVQGAEDITIEDSVTLDDMDKAFGAKYLYADWVTANTFFNFYESHGVAAAADFLDTITSRTA